MQRAIKNNSNDNMLSAELDIVSAYIMAVNPPVMAEVDTAALAAKLGDIAVDGFDENDAAAVKAAVKTALAETVTEVRLSVPGA